MGAFGGRKDIMAHLAPEGPVYQAGTLSGNPLAMAAGLASIEKLRDEQPYRLLDTLGKQIQSAVLDAASVKGLPVQVPQTGSMFAILFTDKPVDSFDVVLGSDADRFKQLFHACLKRGVYLPPSAFETCFISTAHAQGAIDQACDVIGDAIRDI